MSDSNQFSRLAEVRHFGLVKKPLITEKAAQLGVVVFSVDTRASKTQIREAVERVFRVKVARVRTARYNGKPKRVGRSSGVRAGFKKAYVTLADGCEINFVEGV